MSSSAKAAASPAAATSPGFEAGYSRDLLASVVVFLVALPLCMGIAIASGLPPSAGLITGIVGGIVVGSLAGSPLQVSGPAAGLAVIVYEVIREHGIEMLGPIVLLAGAFQLVAGLARIGVWFRVTSPAIVSGMLAGIGVLIVLSQMHVMLDSKPHADAWKNLSSLPVMLGNAFSQPGLSGLESAGLIGLTTIALMIGWEKLRPASLRFVPGALIGVVVASGLANVLALPVNYVNVPANLLDAVRWVSVTELPKILDTSLLTTALAVAFIASAETLLSAAAVDRMHSGVRTNYNRELSAQGVGNLICGALGALPMTGVIVRSSANVQAGARSRLSTILHGTWILGFVVLLPSILRLTPVASLAGVLVFTGFKLLDIKQVRRLNQYGKGPVLIYFVTLVTIVATDLLTGVVVGFALSLLRLALMSATSGIRLHQDPSRKIATLRLRGIATFLRVPRLAQLLSTLPPGTELRLIVDRLDHIDHACLELLQDWERNGALNGSRLVVDNRRLIARTEGRAAS